MSGKSPASRENLVAKVYYCKKRKLYVANETLFNLNESVDMLQQIGLFNYILPLGIFFIILYGILDQYKVISKDKKVNALTALLISSFILLYSYMNNIEWFFAQFYTHMSIALVILLFALTFAVFAYRALDDNKVIPKGKKNVWRSAIFIMSTMIVNSAFTTAPAPLGDWAMDVSGIVLALGMVAAIASIFVKSEGGEEE
ncbi:MAG: hypothetical protein GOV01_01215 [Candidatus Altiarchaeota archaeon]|nr:hypothetical protein [Candidatus Altiarchaeota archaeon]